MLGYELLDFEIHIVNMSSNSQELDEFHFSDVFLTNLNCNVKWDSVCRGMKNDVVSFAYIQGKLIWVKPSLHIFQLIAYSFW